MLKKLLKIVKKVLMAVILLYAYNKIAVSINAIIPINVFTIMLVSILGIPVIISLFVFFVIVF